MDIFDYLKRYKDISFKEKHFNEIDALIIAVLSYVPYDELGFDNIVLYDNNDVDTELLSDVIDDYISSGFVIYDKTFFNKGFAQIPAYNHFLNVYSNNFDYAFICDIDEYICLNTIHNNINDFLNEYNNIYSLYHMICLFWVTYGDNGYIEKSSFDTLSCYDDINNICPQYKMFNIYQKPILNCKKCNIDFIDGISEYFGDAHHLTVEHIKCCDTNGNNINCTNCYVQPIHTNIYIKHFVTRSLENFYKIKMSREICWEMFSQKLDLYYSVNDKIKEYKNYIEYVKENNIEENKKKIFFAILYNDNEYDLIKYDKLTKTYLSKINNAEYNKYLYSEYYIDYYNILKDIKDKYDIIVFISTDYFINYEIFNKFIYIMDEDICYVDIIQERSIDILRMNQINEKCFIISNKVANIILDSNLYENKDSFYWYPYYTIPIILSENNIEIKQLGYLDEQFNYLFNIVTEYNMIYKCSLNFIDELDKFIENNKGKFILRLVKNQYIHLGTYGNKKEFNSNISYIKNFLK